MEAPNIEKPKWLKKIQENSWEAELLISGGAVFALISFSQSFIQLIYHVRNSASFTGLNLFTLLFMLAIKGLTLGFIVHLTLRGLWISLVCLEFSFPSGINFKRLRLDELYLKKERKFNLTSQIISLDHASGIVFFASFAFTLFVIGLLCVGIVLIFIASLNSFEFVDFELEVILVLLSVFYSDMALGILRINKWVGRVYYPIFLIFNYVTLAFIYRPWLQVIFSNLNRWKASGIILLFSIATYLYALDSISTPFALRTMYDRREFRTAPMERPGGHTLYDSNLAENERVYIASIPSEVIEGSFLKVFIPYQSRHDNGIAKAKKSFFAEIVSLSIDGTSRVDVDWIGSVHPITRQLGIVTFVKVDILAVGKHTLDIYIEDDDYSASDDDYPLKIVFWKD